MSTLLLGIDLGTSFIKISVVDAATQTVVASVQHPEQEAKIHSPQPLWAEQNPTTWWKQTVAAVEKLMAFRQFNPHDIAAIGISYQMHGLVMLDADYKPLRPAIIWCDSRAVEIGQAATQALGNYPQEALLNGIGNFTAAKLAWVKENEPEVFDKCHAIALPGDYLAYRLTGQLTTTPSALSEGILWNFREHRPAYEVLEHWGISLTILPVVRGVFEPHGQLMPEIAFKLGLPVGIPVTYKAGDQPNNALAVNVLQPGEVAATGGTSGVLYAVSDTLIGDPDERVNSFAHVTHTAAMPCVGVLLCINGAGISYKWLRERLGYELTYHKLNQWAAEAPAGADGLLFFPFGNGAERLLQNRAPGAGWQGLQFNTHRKPHLCRSVLEGVAFAMAYGLEHMQPLGVIPTRIRATHANLFLSEVFSQTLADLVQKPIELIDSDGSQGAALAAGVGAGIYSSLQEAVGARLVRQIVMPQENEKLQQSFNIWKRQLEIMEK